jgi:hypothetical protein
VTPDRAGTKRAAGTTLVSQGVLFAAIAAISGPAVAVALASVGPGSAVGLVLGVSCLVVAVSVAGVVAGVVLRVQAAKERTLAAIGRPARGTVVSVDPTGLRYHDLQLMTVTVRVQLSGQAPYQAKFRTYIGEDEPDPRAGSELPLRVDPTDRTRVTLAS